MFRSLRIKLIAVIMSVLTILFVSILIAIYIISYQRSADYTEHALRWICRESGFDILKKHQNDNRNSNLDNYYLVLVGTDRTILKIANDDNSGYSDTELGYLAVMISQKESVSGNMADLSYYKNVSGAGTYVAFANISLQISYYKSLFNTILSIGSIGLILLFIVSIWLSKWMIKPVENTFQKQKQFISNASHELKTPIAIISSNADALEREIGESKWLAYIRIETTSLNRLVSDLLQLATIESNEDRTMFTKLNFSELTMSIVLPFESIAFEKQVYLNEQIEDNIFIVGDSTKLGQLISILIDNALNYTEKGGSILVKLTKHHERKLLTVSNTGKEIPLSEQEHIFERFYRIDEAHTRENGNYGLGLSIAKSITLNHNGKISVTSKNNLTTFKVVF